MPLRAKLKRAFGGPSDNSEQPNKKSKHDYPDNVYKPGDKMPKPKYRGKVDPQHQNKLSAFSFNDAWRRRKSSTVTSKSVHRNSECSPRGSRMPSRGNSRRGSTWEAFNFSRGKRAWGMGSRQQSAHDVQDQKINGKLEENANQDDDVANVGLSRHDTRTKSPPPPPPKDHNLRLNGVASSGKGQMNGQLKESESLEPLDTQRTITNGTLFTTDELANAFSQSTLKPSNRET